MLASGMAVLVAPSALGLIRDGIGVVSAWPVIMVLAAMGLVLPAIAPAATGQATAEVATPTAAVT
jgi:hypothetical protein